jgi:hypothetical protein
MQRSASNADWSILNRPVSPAPDIVWLYWTFMKGHPVPTSPEEAPHSTECKRANRFRPTSLQKHKKAVPTDISFWRKPT